MNSSLAFAPPTRGACLHVPMLGRDLPILMDVPDAGALVGLSRDASYRAAREGALPTIRVSQRTLRVPTATWLEQLGLSYRAIQP